MFSLPVFRAVGFTFTVFSSCLLYLCIDLYNMFVLVLVFFLCNNIFSFPVFRAVGFTFSGFSSWLLYACIDLYNMYVLVLVSVFSVY